MRTLPFLPLILLLCCNNAVARQDSLRHAGIVVNMNPTALIDVYNGISLRLGIERIPEKHISFGVDGGVYLHWPNGARGYAVMPQVKYYFEKGKAYSKETRKYIALQYAYRDRAYYYIDSIEASNGTRLKSKFGMRQFIHSYTINYGGIDYWGKRLLLDYYIGAGVRFVSSASDLPPGYSVYDYHDWTVDLITYPQFSTGKLIYPTVCMGLKLGYRAGKLH